MKGFKHYVGGGAGGSGPIPPRPSEAIGVRPDSPRYVDLAATPVLWATAVAQNLVWLAAHAYSHHTITECWVDDQAAMCLRYHDSRGPLGLRFRPEFSPISGPLDPARHDRVSGTAIKQASNYLDLEMGPRPAEKDWTDPDGIGWWGAPPAAGWPAVCDPAQRQVEIPMI